MSQGKDEAIDTTTKTETSSSWYRLSDFYEPAGDDDIVVLRPQFGRIHDYLRSVAPSGLLPGRQHIDPLDFHDLLTYVNLIDVERSESGPRFRFRLVGTMQTVMAKRDITGLYVEEAVLPRFTKRILGNLNRVLETATPLYDRFSMPHPQREFIDSERIYYPLAADGRNIDMILILNGYYGVTGLDPFDKKK